MLTYLFPLGRLKKGKELEKEEAINEVKKNIHLIKAPHAGKNNHCNHFLRKIQLTFN